MSMSQETTRDPCGRLGQPPSDVQITIVPDAAARALRQRVTHTQIATRTRAIAGLVLILAATGAILVGALGGGRNGAIRSTGPQASDRGSPELAAAYGYPPRCLSVTISANDPTFARADFDRNSHCGRYDGYATAIFHRVNGEWRPVLDAIGYSCPVASLPSRVQVDLGVCVSVRSGGDG
jgi:hypothetical protein